MARSVRPSATFRHVPPEGFLRLVCMMTDVSSIGGKLSVSRPVDAAARAVPRGHVDYIDYFRAIAILFVVFGHTYDVAWTHFVSEDLTAERGLLAMVPEFITGATAYFVFISGFLYRQVFFGRVSYGDFLRKKALYVGLPYLVLGIPLALAEIAFGNYGVVLYKQGEFYGSDTFMDMVVLLTTGRMATAYWYIPFIFIVFLASPLFDRFIRMQTGQKLAIVAATTLLAYWVHRPLNNLNQVQSFLYFTNFYLLGMLYCENSAAIQRFTRRRPVVMALTLAMIVIVAVQAIWQFGSGNLERASGDGWLPLGLDLMIAQKHVGILLFCAALGLWGHHLKRLLSVLADYSFGVFFIHPIILAFMIRLPESFSPHVGEPLMDLALYGSFVFLLSLGIAMVGRWMLGRYSRYVIGC